MVGNTFAANGGTSGWHSHPGPSLIFVTAGTVTTYMSDGHHCMQQDYTVGQGFVDPGGAGNMHMIKNNGSVEAKTVAMQLVPAGAARRIDADNPAAERVSERASRLRGSLPYLGLARRASPRPRRASCSRS